MSAPIDEKQLDPKPIDRIILVVAGLSVLAAVGWVVAAVWGNVLAATLACTITIIAAQLAIDYVRQRRTEQAVVMIARAARASQDELIAAVGEMARELEQLSAKINTAEWAVWSARLYNQ